MKTEELKELLDDMSLEEKICQMVQVIAPVYLKDGEESVVTGPEEHLRKNFDSIPVVGSILGTYHAKTLIELQKYAIAHQPHHIPMLFMMDVIHGMSTIFPAPIAQGASFDPGMYEKCMRVSAEEASASGIHVSFTPMCDLVTDPRWGRVMESTGEDPYLNGEMAAAAVRGLQGEGLQDKTSVCACVKHFAGYGGAMGGRDYNTVEVSERTFLDFYLPAYEKGIRAGAGMVMTSFNTVNGIPATINKKLMRDILRKKFGFDGVLITDYGALAETMEHGCAADEREAAAKCIKAGVDMDMMSTVYMDSLASLVKDGTISEKEIDESVWRILTLKNRLGLFENPFKGADPEEETKTHLSESHRDLARRDAEETFVLLKNDPVENGEKLLPLKKTQRIAFIGPYTDRKETNSSWAVTGDCRNNVTIKEAAEQLLDPEKTTYCEGCPVLPSDDPQLLDFAEYRKDPHSADWWKKQEEQALENAKNADVVVMPLGEHYLQTGEATSRADITIPDVQKKLLEKVSQVNPNIVVVLFNGRPLDLREVCSHAKAILEVWLPGTEGGNAILHTLLGDSCPEGKLPMSFPYSAGQIPVTYNMRRTGRPYAEGTHNRYLSKYLDIPNEPLFPFGFGLSYTEFRISDVRLDSPVLDPENGKDVITASAEVTNTGSREGTETVQLYIRDVCASVARPVKELKGFQKVHLLPGETKTVSFAIREDMLRFTAEDNTFHSEMGEFTVWAADSSRGGESVSFTLK